MKEFKFGLAKENMRKSGCRKFTVFISEDETSVILRGFLENGEIMDKTLHRIKLKKSDGEGLSATYQRRFRLRRWLDQYWHWHKADSTNC